MKRERNKGITLISLVVTIIVLIILASVSISLIFAENNSLIGNAKEGVNKTKEQIATEKINLKITNSQMNSYATSQRMPTLQELANDFCEDSEIQYVTLESKKVASLEKIDVGEATSIFTKLKEYPYEFEINSSLQLASIDGVKIGNINNSYSISPEGETQILDENFNQNQHTTTATEDGWIVLHAVSSGTGNKFYNLSVGNLKECGGANDVWQDYCVSLPCKKGQKIMYHVWGNNIKGILEFVPMK